MVRGTTRTGIHSLQRMASAIGCCAVLAAVMLVGGATVHPASVQAAPKVWSPHMKKKVWVIRPRSLGRQMTTWYGPGLYGNRTACGSVLRRNTWGIAHRTLPCGKLVWLRNGRRQIAVPVIDRGPFSGANIDLTQRTARKIGFLRKGRGRIRVSVMRRTIPRKQL